VRGWFGEEKEYGTEPQGNESLAGFQPVIESPDFQSEADDEACRAHFFCTAASILKHTFSAFSSQFR
jgi:hypothetical protein